MKHTNFCQSCGMPLEKTEDYGTNNDGGKNEEYCIYCYKNGEFTADFTMDEMIEFCVPHLISSQPGLSEQQATAQMKEFFPTLKRWS